MNATVTAKCTNFTSQITGRLLVGLDTVVSQTAQAIEQSAQANAPVDTGFLESSIRAERLGYARYAVIAEAFYAVYVELGVRGSPGQPFLMPAYLAHLNDFFAKLQRIVG